MMFNSWEFIVYFPIILLVFYFIPIKYRYIWLLFTSYIFYMNWNLKYSLLLAFSTVITFAGGLLIDAAENSDMDEHRKVRAKKIALALCVAINLLILFLYKYFNFFTDVIEYVISFFNVSLDIPNSSLLLPVGISFYTFQALGYVIDVYRKDVKAESNILKYALFVSFFPQLVAGPIERSKNLLGQINKIKRFDYHKFINGFLLMIWGFFLKLVIADRIAVFVDNVYQDITGYSGTVLLIASVLFAFQIYCDFAGYSIIAMGSASMLGFTLMDNFNAPYLAENTYEFWKRWHISLTSWFRDYLYIPLGGSRKGLFRKYINILIVFAISGLWHGAAWTYVAWGLLNGLYRVIEDVTKGARQIFKERLGICGTNIVSRVFNVFLTFVLIDLTWIFFRADGITDALYVIKKIFTDWTPEVLVDETIFGFGIDRSNAFILLFSVIVMIFAEIAKNKGIVLRNVVLKQNFWVKYFVVAVSIFYILIFGVWGPAYDASNFIYFQF